MSAACNICFFEANNYIEVQKYLFGTNGLIGPTSFIAEINWAAFALCDGPGPSSVLPTLKSNLDRASDID